MSAEITFGTKSPIAGHLKKVLAENISFHIALLLHTEASAAVYLRF